MSRIADQKAILSDTGPLCRLAEAGEAHLEAGAEYLRPNISVVVDVHKELRRQAVTSSKNPDPGTRHDLAVGAQPPSIVS